ncbi:MAG TPA: hypothetical protein VJR23_05410 [Candidatus Acidoferrales bacterium]|nr:hypothetical protein [Candidatus Acidoferrales bacterium]
MRIAHWGLIALLALPAEIAAAQSQQDQAPAQQSQQAQPSQQAQSSQQKPDALAEAARRTREQKKDQSKSAKVWDNDTIGSASGTINVVGQAAAPADNTAAPAAADQGATAGQANTAAAPAKQQDNVAITADLNAAKDKLQNLQKDLDLMQRKLALDQQTFLSNPNHDSDAEGASALKNQQDQITSKQQDVADAQKAVDALQAKLATAGGASSPQPQ